MPRRIVVVGGGVVGCSVAWHLAQRELGEIVLLERDRSAPARPGIPPAISPGGPARHDATVLYAFEAIARLSAETGPGHRLAQDRPPVPRPGRRPFAGSKPIRIRPAAAASSSRMVTGKEAAGLHPLLEGDAITAAWFNPLSGRLNPADLIAAYAKAARRRGCGSARMQGHRDSPCATGACAASRRRRDDRGR